MLRQFQTASSLIGRRAALRCLGLGLVGAAAAACGRGGGTDTAAARPSVTALAVRAFAKGTWRVTSTVTRGPKTATATGDLTVGDGTWSATPGLCFEDFGAEGEYVLDGERLTVVLRGSPEYRGRYPGAGDETYTGSGLPATVTGGALGFGWMKGARSQTCDTHWNGITLTITGSDFYGNSVLVTATRA